MNFEALEYPDGGNNLGGLRPVGYYGFVDDAEIIPELDDAATTLETSITITDSIVMKNGKYMYPMYGEIETAGLDGETQGETGSESTKRTAKWFMKGSSAKTLGLSKNVLGRRMFFVWVEHNGQKRLQGNKNIPAFARPADSLGDTTAARKGVTYEIVDYGMGACPIITSDIPTENASGAI